MKRPYRSRYIAYRKYRSEIWGDLINKGKFIQILKFLLKIFNLQLKTYLRNFSFDNSFTILRDNKNLLNSSLLAFWDEKSFRHEYLSNNNNFPLFIFRDQFFKQKEFLCSNFIPIISKQKDNTLLRNLISEKFWTNLKEFNSFIKENKSLSKNNFLTSLNYLFLCSDKFNNSSKKFLSSTPHPTRFDWIYAENTINSKVKKITFNNWFELNFRQFMNLNKIKRKVLFPTSSKKNRMKNKFVKERTRTAKRHFKITQGDKDVYKMTTWLPLNRRFNIHRWSKWWKLKIQQKKLALFYGIISKKKFKFFNTVTFSSQKMHAYSALSLEMMVCTILFRTNLFTNMYAILSFIRNGGCLLNNKKIIYPFFRMKMGDYISIEKKYFKKLLNTFYIKARSTYLMKIKKNYRALNRPILMLNVPNYLFSNYKILHFKITTLPKRAEIISPISSPFFGKGYDWSIRTQSTY